MTNRRRETNQLIQNGDEIDREVPSLLETQRPRIRAAIRESPHLVLCLDFDGTLAPIVDDPETAEPTEAAEKAVRSLASNPTITTAIVSGRSLTDVRERIDGPSIYAGNHGLEIQRHGTVSVHPIARKRAPLIETVCAILETALDPIPNSRVEHKRLTGTVHLRSVPDPAVDLIRERTRSVTDRVSGDTLELSTGKRVIEISPAIPWGKGNAVSFIEAAAPPNALVVYIGDDTTDEAAFREIEPNGIGIRVGDPDPTWASCRVQTPDAVASLLRWIEAVW